jgi:hypothetical protein
MPATTCAGSGGRGGGTNCHASLSRRCDYINIKSIGMPVSSGNISVFNPRDIITSALPSLGTLQATILGHQVDLITGQSASTTDCIL